MSATQIATHLGCSIRTVWRMVARPGFPPAYRPSTRVVRWDLAAIEAWLVTTVDRPEAIAIPTRLLGAKPRGPQARRAA